MQVKNGYKYYNNDSEIITINMPEAENYSSLYYLIADNNYILHNIKNNELVFSVCVIAEDYFNDLWEEIPIDQAKEEYNFQFLDDQKGS